MLRERGITLVELAVTVAVAAVLLSVAVPGFQSALGSSRLTAAANGLVLSITEARAEAIRRNTIVQVCAASGNGTDTLGAACAASTPGAIFFLANDGTAQLLRAATISGPLTLVSSQALRFDSQGLARTATAGASAPFSGRVADLRSDQLNANNHRCVYMTTGSNLKTCATDANCHETTEPDGCL